MGKKLGRHSKIDQIDLVTFGQAYIEWKFGLITLREIGKRCGVSRGTIQNHSVELYNRLCEAIQKGELKWYPPKNNGLGLDWGLDSQGGKTNE